MCINNNSKFRQIYFYLIYNTSWLLLWAEFCATDPLQHPVTSVHLCSPGPQTVAASRRRPSSQGETGSPQSSDNEHSSGRLWTDTERGESLWQGKSNKHAGLHPMLALRQSHIMAAQSHVSLFFSFSNHLLFLTTDVLNLQPFQRSVCNQCPCAAQNADIIQAAVSWQNRKVNKMQIFSL